MSTRNLPWNKGLSTSSPSVSLFSRKCGAINVSQSYTCPVPFTEMAITHFYRINFLEEKSRTVKRNIRSLRRRSRSPWIRNVNSNRYATVTSHDDVILVPLVFRQRHRFTSDGPMVRSNVNPGENILGHFSHWMKNMHYASVL